MSPVLVDALDRHMGIRTSASYGETRQLCSSVLSMRGTGIIPCSDRMPVRNPPLE